MTFSHRSTSCAAWWAAAAALTACSPLTTLPEPPVAGTETARESTPALGAPAPVEPPVLAAPAASVEAPVPTTMDQPPVAEPPPAEAPRASRESEWDWADVGSEGDPAEVTEAPRKKKKHDD